MVRTPVCDKNGLKKGTWTPEEDKKLVDYITRYGHWNWRLLPKFAGLARCGKSCRLRWLNYLRPNLKRGNYTQEEEETIIKLHQHLGNRGQNIIEFSKGLKKCVITSFGVQTGFEKYVMSVSNYKWSVIAAQMPGRTDNEIKNHWHTNLKKRSQQSLGAKIQISDSKDESPTEASADPHSAQDSCSFLHTSSSSTTTESSNENLVLEDEFAFLNEDMDFMSGNFWIEPYTPDISYIPCEPEHFSPTVYADLWSYDY